VSFANISRCFNCLDASNVDFRPVCNETSDTQVKVPRTVPVIQDES
jgi:hypothetical protein